MTGEAAAATPAVADGRSSSARYHGGRTTTATWPAPTRTFRESPWRSKSSPSGTDGPQQS